MTLISFFKPSMAKKDKLGNTGIDNTGVNNSGDWNSGYGNSGDRNSGDRNSGDWNSGYGNSGDWNSGHRNSGDRNSGDWNSGDRNSGDRNSGDWNSGYGNSARFSSGAFCTEEPYALFFDKPTKIKLYDFISSPAWPDFSDMNPCVWVEEAIMTDEEKAENPTYKTTGGFIRKLEYKQAWAVWRRKTSDANWQKVLALPNFDPQKWEAITGIKIEDSSEAKQKAKQLREKADELLTQAKALEESL